jgi:hypothetical protein
MAMQSQQLLRYAPWEKNIGKASPGWRFLAILKFLSYQNSGLWNTYILNESNPNRSLSKLRK